MTIFPQITPNYSGKSAVLLNFIKFVVRRAKNKNLQITCGGFLVGNK